METQHGVKGSWEDVTRECAIEWNWSVSSKSSNIRIFHHCNIVGYVGGGTPQQCGDGYRVSATKGVSSLLAGEILVEHFEPAPPEYGWVDVTKECTVDLDKDEAGTVNVRHPDREIRLVLHGNSMKPWAVLGGVDFVSEEFIDEANSYRVAGSLKSFKVEHYQEIE